MGVGLFLVVALLRILFRWPLKWMLLGLYGLVFLLGALIKPEFVPMAFDSGGVTTGPMTVPFILTIRFARRPLFTSAVVTSIGGGGFSCETTAI